MVCIFDVRVPWQCGYDKLKKLTSSSFQRRHRRQHLAFQEFKEGATTG
jgi:hypothetical protein